MVLNRRRGDAFRLVSPPMVFSSFLLSGFGFARGGGDFVLVEGVPRVIPVAPAAVQEVLHASLFRLEVPLVEQVGLNDARDPSLDLHPELLQRGDFPRVVRHELDGLDPHVLQDVSHRGVLPCVVR